MSKRVTAFACALACASIAFAPLAARADVPEASALQAGLLAPSNAPLQRALDFEEVSVELLERLFEAHEDAVERRARRHELLGDELLLLGGAAIFGAPQRGDLLSALLETRAIAIAGGERRERNQHQ